jgi:hypothetical protein
MFKLLPILCFGFSVIPAVAEPGFSLSRFFSFFEKGPPAYVSEAALPDGWPLPGPYDQVTPKSYPAYRAAFTPSHRPNSGFLTLFKHIKKNAIPMTSPVEMTMATNHQGGSMEMEQMAFLYLSQKVGSTGPDGENVVVRDVPAYKALSYTWQGTRNDKSIAKARAAIDAALKAENKSVSHYRILGYNSPFIPSSKQTHELQAILK